MFIQWTKFTVLLLIFVFTATAQAAPPAIGGCPVFPADNPWNTDISGASVHPNSDNYIANINANGGEFVHPDFGEFEEYGIPYITVSGTQPKVPVSFEYDDESDPGPYPIPQDAPVEGGGDRHIIVIDTDSCVLYETYASEYEGGPQRAWSAGSGAIYNLDSNALRPDGWTSADAAGLPIFPGLARCDEVMSGEISHALRFTVEETQRAYVYPATHFASNITDPDYPPMGLRLRLKASYDIADLTGQSRVIAEALKRYGMILADNGSNWFISGETTQVSPPCWNDDDLNQLKDVPGTAFEVIVSPPPANVVLPAPTLHLPEDGAGVDNPQVTLGWNPVTSAVEYEVQFGRDNPPTETVATTLSTEYTQVTLPDPLLTGLTYFWRVRAFDDDDNPTPWSEVRSLSLASTADAAPLRNYFVSSTPLLTWSRVSWATQYQVQVSASASFANPIEQIVSANTSAFTTPTLDSGIYYWRVRAQNAAGAWSGWSVADSFMVAV